MPDPDEQPPPARVVIALPVYNAATDLPAALATALEQGDDVEVHVFDNASTDDTVEIAKGLIPAERVHVAGTNAGAVANFERALKGTTSGRFLWLAHDDRLSPGFVAAAERALDAAPRAGAAVPTVNFVDGKGEILLRRPPRPGLDSRIPYRRLLAFADQLGWMEVYGLHRRDRLMAALPMKDTYGFDVLLTWRLLLRNPFCLAPDAVLSYRIHRGKTIDSSTDDQAAPGSRREMRRPFMGLWARLWLVSGEPQVPRLTRWQARLVLLTLPFRHTGRTHLQTDKAYAAGRKAAAAALAAERTGRRRLVARLDHHHVDVDVRRPGHGEGDAVGDVVGSQGSQTLVRLGSPGLDRRRSGPARTPSRPCLGRSRSPVPACRAARAAASR